MNQIQTAGRNRRRRLHKLRHSLANGGGGAGRRRAEIVTARSSAWDFAMRGAAHSADELAEQTLQHGFQGLRFARPLEAQFQQVQAVAAWSRLRAAAAAGLLMFLAYASTLPADVAGATPAQQVLRIVGLLAVAAAAGGIFGLRLKHRQREALFAAGAAAAAAAIAGGAGADLAGRHGILLLIPIMTAFAAQLSFRFAAAVAALTGAVLLSPDGSAPAGGAPLTDASAITLCLGICLAASYILEHMRRRAFLQAQCKLRGPRSRHAQVSAKGDIRHQAPGDALVTHLRAGHRQRMLWTGISNRDAAMAEVINLNRVRKRKAREEATAQAAVNRVRFGRSKAEKLRDEAELEQSQRRLDQLHRDAAPDAQLEYPLKER